ncbi:MAG: molybdopterin-dependent oxidoreductase [Chloroflexi bacterium]|nr:molybdopterin-dependent oxidoreductase [Chloroflexota bacterium]
MTGEPRRPDEGERATPRARRLLSRARFLGLLAGGAAVGALSTRVFGLVDGWRENTVEESRPVFDPGTYRLTVDGLVARPLSLDYEALRALPAVRQVSDFHCVEGWMVPDVRWDGVLFQSLAELVGPLPDARYVTFHSLGGVYRDSLSLTQARLPGVLIAYDLDGAPLSRVRGAPARLVMPRMFGYKGPKWLTRVEFRDRQDLGYWQQRGWRVDAWIRSSD